MNTLSTQIRIHTVNDSYLSSKYLDAEDSLSAINDIDNRLSGIGIDVTTSTFLELTRALGSTLNRFGGEATEIEYDDPVIPIDRESSDIIYKFAVFSDIHLSRQADDPDNTGLGNGKIDFTRGLSCAGNHDVDFACIAGDIGLNKSNIDFSDDAYDKCILSAGISFPISCCGGNHDTTFSEEDWKKTTSCDLNYYKLVNDNQDLFIFISLPVVSPSDWSYNTTTPYSESTISFLSSTLKDNPKKNVFLFMHLPLNSECATYQFAGLGNMYYPGSSYNVGNGNNPVDTMGSTGINCEGFQLDSTTLTNAQNEKFLDILKNYDGQVIVFTGHSHYIFEVDEDIKNVIFAQAFPNVYTVHIPSLNYPRERQRKQICGTCPDKAPSQGYIIERHKKSLVLKGYEFNARLDHEFGDLLRTYTINLI